MTNNNLDLYYFDKYKYYVIINVVYLFSLAFRFLLADSRRFNIEESDNCKAPTEGNQIDLGVELGVVAGLTAVLLI